MAGPKTDVLLATFVDTIEKMGGDKFSFDLTLLVDGTLVSGMIISMREFLEGVGGQFDEATQQATGAKSDVWLEMFSGVAKSFQEGLDRREVELKQLTDEIQDGKPTLEQKERLAELERQTIHLKNVAILGPNNQLIRVPFWRGRLSKVGGWNVGGMSEPR